MHTVMFNAKRAHLTTVAHGQHLLARVARVEGMTPARFDLLCLLRQAGLRLPKGVKDTAGMMQAGICRRLGLHASTVSKMLKRLEEMGWVTRARDYYDRRRKVIVFTDLGSRRTWEAMRRIFRGRLMLRPFERLCRDFAPGVHVLDAVDEFAQTFAFVARRFGDASDVHYNFGLRDRRTGVF